MNVAFMFSDAIIAGAWEAAKHRLERKGDEGYYLLDDGVMLSVCAEREQLESEVQENLSTGDLLFGGDLLQANSMRVELVPSLKSRLRRAWQDITSGFEFSLAGRAVAFTGLVAVASIALGTFAPVSAEELPTIDSHKCPHYDNSQENAINGLVANTKVTPKNHLFRRSALSGDGLVGGYRHTNVAKSTIKIKYTTDNSVTPFARPALWYTPSSNVDSGYKVGNVFKDKQTDVTGPSGLHLNIKHDDFIY